MLFLKQSANYTAKIGPFIDDTDGKTAETGLTISQADVRLSKNGGDFAQKNEANSCTHDELGYYDCPLNTTDTGTIGKLQLAVHESGALPVFHEFMVMPANVYDGLFSSTDGVPVSAIAANAITAAALDPGAANEVANACGARVVEGTYTQDQLLRGIAATQMAKTSGMASATAIIRDLSDTKDMITATVDSAGNRTFVTRDLA